jgi:putative glutamine amidotransferase
MTRPVIGLTPDVGSTAAREGRPALPRLELKQAYLDAIWRAGGLPLVLPLCPDESSARQAVSLCAGLVVTGGGFDLDPALYGQTPRPGLGELRPERTASELLLLRAALSRRLRVLGICGGLQLLVVNAGGALYQDLPRELPSAGEHTQPHDPRAPFHPVLVKEGSLLHRLTGAREVTVNSTHHQSVRDLPARSGVITGAAPDGVVEAIELAGHHALGVQWHPELLAGEEHLALYRWVCGDRATS